MKNWTPPKLIEADVRLTNSDWFREWGIDAEIDDLLGANNFITRYRSQTEEETLS